MGRAIARRTRRIMVNPIARIFIVVTRNVAGLLSPFEFAVIFLNHFVLNHFAALGVHRMRDVGVKFCSPFWISGERLFRQLGAALIAVGGAKVVFKPAVRAVRHQFAARHGDERAAGAFNDLQVANDECVVERNGAKSLKAIIRPLH